MPVRDSFCGRISVVMLTLVVSFVLFTSSAAPAQQTTPRAEIFAGYSWVNPGGRLLFGTAPTPTSSVRVPDLPKGFDSSLTINFNKYLGVTADFGGHWADQASLGTFLFGPRLSYNAEHVKPFVHALIGAVRLSPSGPASETGLAQTGFGGAFGGGLDLNISRHFGFRLIEADYLYQAYKKRIPGPEGTFNGARLQGGPIFMFGEVGKPLPPPTAACSVQPAAVMAGEPVTANVSTQNFNPKHTLSYKWTATGGKVTSKDTTASVDTAGLAPGAYTVTATVTDPKAKKNNTATCNASLTINEPPKHPPTISCSANPTTVRSGDPVTVTAQSTNPDNRPLTYQWNASAGRVTGTGPSATLDTAGAPAGPLTVTGTVTDDRGLSANCQATVNVEVPPPPPQASKLNEIQFPNKKKPARVDNTAKAILDDVALRLQRDADAKAVIVGQVDPAEKGGVKLAQQRAVNTKAYLTDEKGIDPARIEVRTGNAGGTRAEIYLVPAGATFNVEGTQTFSEASVKKPAVQKRGAAKPKAAKKAAPAPKS
jgi:outer membrane protein OmpA-like peptidoglycan-associated protein